MNDKKEDGSEANRPRSASRPSTSTLPILQGWPDRPLARVRLDLVK